MTIDSNYKRVLDKRGTTMVLKRSGTSNLTLKGYLRTASPNVLVGELSQSTREVVFGTTELDNAAWPVPIRKGDKVVIFSKTYTIQHVEEVSVADDVVRYNIFVRG